MKEREIIAKFMRIIVVASPLRLKRVYHVQRENEDCNSEMDYMTRLRKIHAEKQFYDS